MPAQRILAATGSANPTTSWTATVANGANVREDDVIYVANTNRDATANPSVSDDSGDGRSWTRLGESTARKLTIWYKRLGPLAGTNWGSATVTITCSGSTGSCAGGYVSYRGVVKHADPFTNYSWEANASANETHAGFTPSTPSSFIVLVVGNVANDNAVSSQAATTPSSLAEDFDHLSTGGSDSGCAWASALQSGGPSATGSVTWAQTNGVTESVVFAIPPQSEMPEIIAVDAGYASGGVDSTTHDVYLPFDPELGGGALQVLPGRLMVMTLVVDGTPTITWPSGWSSITNYPQSNGTLTIDKRYRVADGTESTSITITLSAAETLSSICALIKRHSASTNTPTAPAVATGNDASPEPPTNNPAVTTGWLWLIGLGADDNPSVTGRPTGYTLLQELTGSGAGDVTISVVAKTTYASSENPERFTLGSSQEWVVGTLGVRVGTEGLDHPIHAEPGSYSKTGAAATPAVGRGVIASPGSYLVDGGLSYRDAVMALGPARYWRLGDANGQTDIVDETGNIAEAATSVIGATLGASGLITGDQDTCADFDGTDDQITATDTTDPTAYTILAWVVPDVTTDQGVISRGDSGGVNASHSISVDQGEFKHHIFDNGSGTDKEVAGSTSVVAGTRYFVAITAANGGMMRLYVQGQEEGTALSVTTLWPDGDRWRIGRNIATPSAGFWNGKIDEVAIFHKVLTAQEIEDLYDIGVGAGPGAKLLVGRMVQATAGSYTISGVDATFEAPAGGYNLVLDPGTYDVSGATAAALKGSSVNAEPGAYVITGSAAALLLGALLNGEAGSYSISGVSSELLKGSQLVAEPGTYVVTGQLAALLRDAIISAEAGSYAVTGSAAALLLGALLNGESGVYAISGAAAELIKVGALEVNAEPGAYAVSGAAAELLRSVVMNAEPGAYSLTGSEVALLKGFSINAEPGVYVIAGTDVEFELSGAPAPDNGGEYIVIFRRRRVR